MSSTRQHTFLVSKNAKKGPLSVEEDKAFSVFVKRHVVNYHGSTCLKVPAADPPRTFMPATEPNKLKVGERQVQRKAEQVRDVMDWSSQGDTETIKQVQHMVFQATALTGVVELTIPEYGSM